MVSGRCFTPGNVQGPWRRMGDGGGVGMPRVHQVQQRPQRPLRAALVVPHDDLRCEDIDPCPFRHPRRSHLVHALTTRRST